MARSISFEETENRGDELVSTAHPMPVTVLQYASGGGEELDPNNPSNPIPVSVNVDPFSRLGNLMAAQNNLLSDLLLEMRLLNRRFEEAFETHIGEVDITED